jgi:predicted ATPase
MPALLRLSAFNFLSLRDVDVPLGPLNVLVGPNESGKSNFLDVIQFLGDSVREDLQPALARRGGWERVAYRGERKDSARENGPLAYEVEIRVEANVTRYASRNAPDEYTLRFWLGRIAGRNPRDVLVRTESFRFKRTGGAGRRIKVEGNDAAFIDEAAGRDQVQQTLPLREDSLGLSTLTRLAPEQGGTEITKVADLFSTFRVFDVDVSAARRPSVRTRDAELSPDGANVAAFLAYLSEEVPDRFEELKEDARAMVPGLRDITFRELSGPSEGLAVELVEEGLTDPTRLGEASFGTIRMLALLAMLYDPDPPLLTCVEEIDHGLHPYPSEPSGQASPDVSQALDDEQDFDEFHSELMGQRLESVRRYVPEQAFEEIEELVREALVTSEGSTPAAGPPGKGQCASGHPFRSGSGREGETEV